MKTAQKNRWIRKPIMIGVLINGIILCTFQSEVTIGEASSDNNSFLNLSAITIDHQTYWINSSDKKLIRDEAMAYVYKYNVLLPNVKVISSVRPLETK